MALLLHKHTHTQPRYDTHMLLSSGNKGSLVRSSYNSHERQQQQQQNKHSFSRQTDRMLLFVWWRVGWLLVLACLLYRFYSILCSFSFYALCARHTAHTHTNAHSYTKYWLSIKNYNTKNI